MGNGSVGTVGSGHGMLTLKQIWVEMLAPED